MKRRWPWFAAGVVAGSLGLFGPIEEIFHYFFLRITGTPARIVSWTEVRFHHPTIIGALAGPFGLALVLYILTFTFLYKRKNGAGLFVFGAAHAAFLLAYVGSDLQVWTPYLTSRSTMVAVLVVWTILNSLLIAIGWLAVKGLKDIGRLRVVVHRQKHG